jgi:MFS family permease
MIPKTMNTPGDTPKPETAGSNRAGSVVAIREGKGFYGWITLAGAALVYFVTSGIFYYSYGVFLPAICSEYGWSRATVGGGLSVALLAFGLPSPLIGASVARFGPRTNIVLGNLLVVLGLAGMSVVTEVWQLYLFYGILMGLGAGFGTYMACAAVVNNWFVRKRSLGMGLVISSGGLGGFVFPPLTVWLLSGLGLPMVWLAFAIIQLVCSVVIGGLILVRDRPEDMGQAPDGISSGHANEREEEISHTSRVYQSPVDWQTRQALREPTTWLIAAFCAANSLALGTVVGHQVAYLMDRGFSPIVAAMALSLVLGMSMFGRLAFGLLGARFEGKDLAMASLFSQVIALVILLTTKSLPLIYIYAALFGVSCGALIVALPTFIGAYYGRAHYTQILGLLFPLTLIAEAAGPVIAGAINDALATYIPALVIVAVFSTVGLICAVLACPPKPPE